jgi:DNA-binding transcriptional LysR family regulator
METAVGTFSLDALACFVAVAESASFSVAARRLGMPRSTLSRSIARLESDLGERLIHRTTRRVSLGAAGLALLERARPALGELRAALAQLPERGTAPSGELRVTAPNDFGNQVLAGLLPEFTRRYPAIRLDLRLTNRVLDLAAEGVDLAIRAVGGTPASSAMVARRLSVVELAVYASPGYIARRGTPRDLADTSTHDWVLFAGGGLRRIPPPPGKVVAWVDDFQFVHHAVRAGVGLGRLPSFLALPDVKTGALVPVLARETQSEGRLYLVYQKTPHPSRRLIALRDFLLETSGKPP